MNRRTERRLTLHHPDPPSGVPGGYPVSHFRSFPFVSFVLFVSFVVSLAVHALSTSEVSAAPALQPQFAGGIGAAAFSSDGRRVAVAGYRQVWLYDVPASGAQLRPSMRLAGAAGPVNAVAFSPDGRLLAAAGGVAGQSGEIQLWDVAQRRLRRVLRGHRDAIYGIAFSPDGKILAAASYDRLLSLWPVTGGASRKLKDHIDAVYSVAFSPDGKQIASASGDRTIKVWDVATGRRVYTLSEPLGEQYCVAFSPNGKQIAAAGADKILRIWNVTAIGGSLAASAFGHEGAIIRLLYSADGSTLISSGEDRRIKLWDSVGLTERQILERQSDWATAIALSPTARRLVAGRLDGTYALYNLNTGRNLPSHHDVARGKGKQQQ